MTQGVNHVGNTWDKSPEKLAEKTFIGTYYLIRARILWKYGAITD